MQKATLSHAGALRRLITRPSDLDSKPRINDIRISGDVHDERDAAASMTDREAIRDPKDRRTLRGSDEEMEGLCSWPGAVGPGTSASILAPGRCGQSPGQGP
jgi:hypothetical protein